MMIGNVQKRQVFLPLLMIVLGIIIAYLPYFQNVYPGDNANLIADNARYNNGLLLQGRYGIVLINQLFGHYGLATNGLVSWLAILLLILIAFYLYYLLGAYIVVENIWVRALCSLIFAVNPAVYGMFYYRFQAIPVAIATFFVLAAGQLWIAKRWAFWIRAGLSIVLLGAAFLTFQSLILFAGSLALFWLLFRSEDRKSLFGISLLSGFLGLALYEGVNLTYLHFYAHRLYTSYTVDASSELGFYFNWDHLFDPDYFQFTSLIFLLLMAGGGVFLVITLVIDGKNMDKILFILFTLSLFIFPLVFGNINLPPRIYFASLGLVLVGIILKNQQKADTLVVGMLFITVTVIMLVFWGKLGYAGLPFGFMVALLSIFFVVSMYPNAKVLFIFTLLLVLMNMTSIGLINKTFNQDKEYAALIAKELGREKLPAKEINQYSLWFSGDIDVADHPVSNRLVKAWTALTPKVSLSDASVPSTRNYQVSLLRIEGYRVKAIYGVAPKDELQQNVKTFTADLKPVTEKVRFMAVDPLKKNIFVKLSN